MSKFAVGAVITGVALVGTAVAMPLFIEKVPAGEVGIVYNTQGVEDTPLSSGWHITGFFDKVIQYPTKLRTVQYDDMVVSTRDGKNIKIDLSYTYKVDAAKAVSIYNEFGNISIDDIEAGYLQKRMLDSARTIVSQYDLLDVYGAQSAEAGSKIQDAFEKDVAKLGFMVSDVALGAPKPDAATQDAIDARIAASQENEKKKLELENDKIDAERKKIQAQGEADKKLIEAKAEAEALKVKASEITQETLMQEWIEAWKSGGAQVPQVSTSESASMFMPFPEMKATEKENK